MTKWKLYSTLRISTFSDVSNYEIQKMGDFILSYHSNIEDQSRNSFEYHILLNITKNDNGPF